MEKKIDYRSIKKVNQSSLKKILISPSAYQAAVNKYEKSTENHFVFGSLVDDMLLAPKTIDDKYYKMRATDISDTLKLVALHIYDAVKADHSTKIRSEWYPLFDHSYVDFILKACLAYDYQPRWGDSTKVKNIPNSCGDYFAALIDSDGKTVISEEEYNKATLCVAALKSDKYTSKYLKKSIGTTSVYTHVILEFKVNNVECKGELDKIYIDHTAKTIQPIDYKTTGKPINGFPYDFWKYRYDFQAAFYKEGLLQDVKIKKLQTEGYTLLDFQYIVVESDLKNNPMIFTISNEVNSIGLNGGTLSNGKELEGVYDAISRYNYHTTTSKWDYPQEYYEKGSLIIEI
jgi:hypothetical protein